jgi:catechol 2,3-dioxygenase
VSTVGFYRDVVGFGLMAALGRQAAFLAAGGYHHHLGANIWESAGAPVAPDDTATLTHYTVVLPSERDRDEVVGRLAASGHEPQDTPGGVLARDPSGIPVVLAA